MNLLSIDIMGGAWVTPSGIGSLRRGDEFVLSGGSLPELKRQYLRQPIEQRWGRFDPYSKAGLIAACLAIEDARLNVDQDHVVTGLVASTVTGSLEVDDAFFKTVLPEDGLLASPNLFAYTLPNCMLGEVSILNHLTGPCLVVDQTTADMLTGIRTGIQWLEYGLTDRVVAGYCNTEYGLEQIQSPCKPAAVFVVIKKSASPCSFACAHSMIYYENQEITTLENLIKQASSCIMKEVR